jgi:hypothetical protein
MSGLLLFSSGFHIDWLGYGNLTCGQQTLHLPSISTTNDVLMENNSEDEDDDEDNFINAVDEVNGQMQQRLMDIQFQDLTRPMLQYP